MMIALFLVLMITLAAIATKNSELRIDVLKALDVANGYRHDAMVARNERHAALHDRDEAIREAADLRMKLASSAIRITLEAASYQFIVSAQELKEMEHWASFDKLIEARVRMAKAAIESRCAAEGTIPFTDFRVEERYDVIYPGKQYVVSVGTIRKMAVPGSAFEWYGQRVIPDIDPDGNIIGVSPLFPY